VAVTVEAVYEDGVLKPAGRLPWKDGERVRVAVSSLESPILSSYGIIGWNGTHEELERALAEADELEDLP
jgi:predicted DNA-binding antitoxin AbrB/MazE fold protein